LNRLRKALVAGTAVVVAVLVVAIFFPVISVDNYLFYGKVSVTCYYLGFGGLNVQSHQAAHLSPYYTGIPSFSNDCSYYVTGYLHLG